MSTKGSWANAPAQTKIDELGSPLEKQENDHKDGATVIPMPYMLKRYLEAKDDPFVAKVSEAAERKKKLGQL